MNNYFTKCMFADSQISLVFNNSVLSFLSLVYHALKK